MRSHFEWARTYIVVKHGGHILGGELVSGVGDEKTGLDSVSAGVGHTGAYLADGTVADDDAFDGLHGGGQGGDD